jgi:hypothetical protein
MNLSAFFRFFNVEEMKEDAIIMYSNIKLTSSLC